MWFLTHCAVRSDLTEASSASPAGGERRHDDGRRRRNRPHWQRRDGRHDGRGSGDDWLRRRGDDACLRAPAAARPDCQTLSGASTAFGASGAQQAAPMISDQDAAGHERQTPSPGRRPARHRPTAAQTHRPTEHAVADYCAPVGRRRSLSLLFKGDGQPCDCSAARARQLSVCFVVVCRGPNCRERGGLTLRKRLVELLRREPTARLVGYACFGQCDFGPNVAFYPEGTWYGGLSGSHDAADGSPATRRVASRWTQLPLQLPRAERAEHLSNIAELVGTLERDRAARRRWPLVAV